MRRQIKHTSGPLMAETRTFKIVEGEANVIRIFPRKSANAIGAAIGDNAVADATLWAAAPQLLSALKLMHNYFITENIPGSIFKDDAEFNALETLSMNAISKAEGKDL